MAGSRVGDLAVTSRALRQLSFPVASPIVRNMALVGAKQATPRFSEDSGEAIVCLVRFSRPSGISKDKKEQLGLAHFPGSKSR